MNAKKIIVVVIVVVAIFVVAIRSIQNRPDSFQGERNGGRIQVVTSFYPLYFFTKQVAGDMADVTNITPAGGEPHDYEPSPRDIALIEKSKLLILNGGGLETWGKKIKDVINPEQTLVIVASEEIINQTIAENGDTVVDPHVWLAPLLAEKIVEKIASGLLLTDPAHATYYKERSQILESKLIDLDLKYHEGLANCTDRNIVTAHAAFGYLTSAYKLNQIPIAGLSPDTEPSPRQLVEIVQLVKKNNVKYIFFESLASPKLSQTIAREVGAQTLVLNPIEGLTPSEIVGGKDYFSEMESNLINLETACK